MLNVVSYAQCCLDQSCYDQCCGATQKHPVSKMYFATISTLRHTPIEIGLEQAPFVF